MHNQNPKQFNTIAATNQTGNLLPGGGQQASTPH